MDRNHAIVAIGAAALLIVGTLAGRSLGQGDSEAANSYSQAATDQRVSILETEKKILIGKLNAALQDREALAKQLGNAAPALDVGGAITTATKAYEQLKTQLATVEANAKAAVVKAKSLLSKTQADAKAQTQKLERDVQKLREENRKLRSDVKSLGEKVETLNTTIKGLEGFKNPFGR